MRRPLGYWRSRVVQWAVAHVYLRFGGWLAGWTQRRGKAAAGAPQREQHDEVVDSAIVAEIIKRSLRPEVPHRFGFFSADALRERLPGAPYYPGRSPILDKYPFKHLNDMAAISVAVVVLYTDVAADYDLDDRLQWAVNEINGRLGKNSAEAVTLSKDIQLKPIAVAAGLGHYGRNALFFSSDFGLNCKLGVLLFSFKMSEYSAINGPSGAERIENWALPDCLNCTRCTDACPTDAIQDFRMVDGVACDRILNGFFLGTYRGGMCRICQTSCPPSNDILRRLRASGAPKKAYWDHDKQYQLVTNAYYRQSFVEWLYKRFYNARDPWSEHRGRLKRKRRK